MAERCVKGDYIGFTFGDVHSSELGLMRVSNGSRYEQDLLPPLQDKTVQVNGRDGAVYFNSTYNTRPIKVPVAFDNMTEESFQKLKELLMDKKPKYLWFDETPYKQWLVKSANAQNFKWVCFDESKNIERINDGDSEGTKKRIYKGEGTLEFSCFTPYAESRVTFLDDPVDSVWVWNREESPRRLVQNIPLFPTLVITKDGVTTKQELKRVNANTFIDESGNEIIYKNTELTKIAEQGYFVCIKQARGATNYTDNMFVVFPDDLKVYGNKYVYFIEDESFLPVEVNAQESFYAYNIGSGCDKQKISIKRIQTTSGIDYYYVKGDKLGLSILFYKDPEGNFYYIDPETGLPNKDMDIYLFFIDGHGLKEQQQVTLIENYNASEWIVSSKLREKEWKDPDENIISFETKNLSTINVYNAGTEPSNLNIYFSSKLEKEETLYLYSSYSTIPKTHLGSITIKPFEFVAHPETGLYDTGFMIDTKLKMIRGTRHGIPTDNIYSKQHIGGDYFKIPVCADDEYYIIKSTTGNEFTVDYKHYYI